VQVTVGAVIVNGTASSIPFISMATIMFGPIGAKLGMTTSSEIAPLASDNVAQFKQKPLKSDMKVVVFGGKPDPVMCIVCPGEAELCESVIDIGLGVIVKVVEAE
jgi:hypothetical protein